MQCIDAHEGEMVCIGVRWCSLVCRRTEYSHYVHHTKL
jgi:hypothetical protein